MWDRTDSLKVMLKKLESFKQEIMVEINLSGQNEESVKMTTVYPMAKVKPLNMGDYDILQFSYEGVLPSYKEKDSEYVDMIRHYYYHATFDSYDYSKLKLPISDKVVLLFAHYFNDHNLRDLDNLNKKYVQDAIRQTKVIKDDNWMNVWNMDVAFKDPEKSHLQVFVVPAKHISHFIDYLMDEHDNIQECSKLMKVGDYEADFIKKAEKLKEAKKKKRNESEKFF